MSENETEGRVAAASDKSGTADDGLAKPAADHPGFGKVTYLAAYRPVRKAAVSEAQQGDMALDTQGRKEEGDEADDRNPLALCLGLLVVLTLLFGSWFVINQMHCNPLFSDAGLGRAQACR